LHSEHVEVEVVLKDFCHHLESDQCVISCRPNLVGSETREREEGYYFWDSCFKRQEKWPTMQERRRGRNKRKFLLN
jgi:hypothetical protein